MAVHPMPSRAVLHAVGIGLRRGRTEFVQSLRSSQDQWFYLFTAFLTVGYLYLRRDTPVEGTDLMLPSVALPSILGGLLAFGLVIGPAYSLAMEKEDGTLLRAKAVPHGLVGYSPASWCSTRPASSRRWWRSSCRASCSSTD